VDTEEVLEEERAVIRDHNDYPLQEDIQTVGEDEAALFCSTEYLMKVKDSLENYTFSTEVAYNVKGEARL
jgi:hypothetical protein